MNDQLKQQIIETKEEQEKREELELYIEVQENTYADFLANVERAMEEIIKTYNDLVEKYDITEGEREIFWNKVEQDRSYIKIGVLQYKNLP